MYSKLFAFVMGLRSVFMEIIRYHYIAGFLPVELLKGDGCKLELPVISIWVRLSAGWEETTNRQYPDVGGCFKTS